MDAIVVDWNGRRYLPRCLKALGRSTIPVQTTAIANASSDGSAEYLRIEPYCTGSLDGILEIGETKDQRLLELGVARRGYR